MIATLFLVDKIGRKRILIIELPAGFLATLLLFVTHTEFYRKDELVGYIPR